jgi:hypothetical protein
MLIARPNEPLLNSRKGEPDKASMDEQTPPTRENVEAWADAVLEQHRERAPEPNPGPPWYMRELPRVGAAIDVLHFIGVIVFGVASVILIHIIFNSG